MYVLALCYFLPKNKMCTLFSFLCLNLWKCFKKKNTLRDMEESCTCAPTNWIKELLVKYLACLSMVCYWRKLDKWKTKTGSGRPNKIKQVCTAISNTWWGLCRGLELHFSPWCSGSCQNWVNYEHRKLPFWSTMQFHLEQILAMP